MRPEAPLNVVHPKVDPWTKQFKARPYAEFSLQALGVFDIDGYDVSGAVAVRLPETVEPGDCFDLQIGTSGGVVVATPAGAEPESGTLLDSPRVIVTEWLTVQFVATC